MAFLPQEKKGDSTYLRVVQSYMDTDGKNRHRTLFNMGKATDYSPEALFHKMKTNIIFIRQILRMIDL